MSQYAFVLDQSRCIGCHACTVACKVEHGVELGVFRTWVKYIERGDFPNTRRHFSVLRCNHCTDAPCVEICPVTALFKREDGIVDFDPSRCIGCKACLNACPYDALYIDPKSETAAKCNFCAHRIDNGLKPSCEVVCPVGAIISGDVDDPDSEVRRILGTLPTTVRAPEQGTGPNVYYVGADSAAIDPLIVGGDAYLTTEVAPSQAQKLAPLNAEAEARATSDIFHPQPWGWKVSSYFLSKGVAAGAMMIAVLMLAVGARRSAFTGVVPGLLGLVGIAITGGFLVWDLKQPRRFYYLFTRPQWRSWLARGALVINVATAVALAWTVAAITDAHGLLDVLRWAMVPAGALLAGYTAFLFNQCEGRDLWQSPLLLAHTIINAVLAGAGGLGLVALPLHGGTTPQRVIAWCLLLAAIASAALIIYDTYGPHPTRQAERAASNLRRDVFALQFWSGLVIGLALPAAAASAYLLVAHATALLGGAGLCALIGLWLYEDAWVRAGQSVPLS